MSLAHSHWEPLGEKEEACTKIRVRAPETRPRALMRPDSFLDSTTMAVGDGDMTQPRPFSKHSGNAKPQEPMHLMARYRPMPGPGERQGLEDQRRKQLQQSLKSAEEDSAEWRAAAQELRRLASEPLPPNRTLEVRAERPRTAGHIHSKPWCSSAQPGHRENAALGDSRYRRTWMTDHASIDRVGKWNSERTKQHYLERDEALFKLRPNDEIFAVRANMKYWTHLQGAGTKAGGQEKLEVAPQRGDFSGAVRPDNRCRCAAACRHGAGERNGRHLKGGLYAGKFDGIRHAQLILQASERPSEVYARDRRPPFDSRLKDDVIAHDHETDKQAVVATYDIFRPAHTLSCPQLGADFVRR